MSDLDTSGGSEDDEEEGGPEGAEIGGGAGESKKSHKRKKKGKGSGVKDEDVTLEGIGGGKEEQEGYTRTDFFKIEKSLLVYGYEILR